MATVTNWIEHLSADKVQGAVYPGVGTEGILVIVLLVIWIGWHVLQNNAESEDLEKLYELFKSVAISEEDFQKAKKKILD